MFLRGKNKLCDYLVDIVERDGAAESPYTTWTRAIWDRSEERRVGKECRGRG